MLSQYDIFKPVCPLMSYRDEHCTPRPCKESGCAWWDRLHERCFVSTMADALDNMEADG